MEMTVAMTRVMAINSSSDNNYDDCNDGSDNYGDNDVQMTNVIAMMVAMTVVIAMMCG